MFRTFGIAIIRTGSFLSIECLHKHEDKHYYMVLYPVDDSCSDMVMQLLYGGLRGVSLSFRGCFTAGSFTMYIPLCFPFFLFFRRCSPTHDVTIVSARQVYFLWWVCVCVHETLNNCRRFQKMGGAYTEFIFYVVTFLHSLFCSFFFTDVNWMLKVNVWLHKQSKKTKMEQL